MNTALVTGGSSGLGLALSGELAARGYHVIIVAREEKKLEQAVAALRHRGFHVTGYAGDVCRSAGLEKIAADLKAGGISLDFLVVNAGIVQVRLLNDYQNMEEMKQQIANESLGRDPLDSAVYAADPAGAKILFISSGFGMIGAAGYSVYCAAKAGLINFADALRNELRHQRIDVYVACPGDLDTPSYRQEFIGLPEWMRAKRERWSAVLSPEVAARKILQKCSGRRFIITCDTGISALLMAKKILPERILSAIMSHILSRP